MQVISEVDKVQTEADGTPTEAKLTQGLAHPSIVCMHAYKLVEGVRRESLEGQVKGAASLKHDELWLILEFCDSGSIQVREMRGLSGRPVHMVLALLAIPTAMLPEGGENIAGLLRMRDNRPSLKSHACLARKAAVQV
jgi:hypothetical protein